MAKNNDHHVVDTATTTAAAVVAGVATLLATILVGTAVQAQRRYYRRWNSESEQRKRREFEVSARAFVGPNPTMMALLNDDDDGGNKSLQMLTSYYEPPPPQQQQQRPQRPITLVIIHGFGCTSLEFSSLVTQLLQQQQQQHSKNCNDKMAIFRYDRILFVDDPQNCLSHKSRTATTLANELYQLLQQQQQRRSSNDIAPRYLLLGHSYGGLIAQEFVRAYYSQPPPPPPRDENNDTNRNTDDDIVGMVLIDPAHERQFRTFPRDFTVQFTTAVPPLLSHWYPKMAGTGFFQWLDRHDLFNFPPLFLFPAETPELRRAATELYSGGGQVWRRAAAELRGSMETFDRINSDTNGTAGSAFRSELHSILTQRNIHTGLVVAGRRQYSPTFFPRAVTQAFLDLHRDMPLTKVFLASQSDHWVHLQQPEIVMEAIHHVLSSSSSSSSSSFLGNRNQQ